MRRQERAKRSRERRAFERLRAQKAREFSAVLKAQRRGLPVAFEGGRVFIDGKEVQG